MPVLSNAKHERFAQELAKGKTANEAYVLAGYKANDGNAIRLKGNERIAERVAEILDRSAIRAEVTVASILAELDEAKELAKRIEQPAPMIAASMGKAKIAGILVDRTEHTGKDGGPIQTQEVKARDEVSRRISSISTRSGQAGDHSKPH